MPRHDGSHVLPEALEGEVPDPARPPSGCRFHPRCPLRVEQCSIDEPTLQPVAGDHAAACWVTSPPPQTEISTSKFVQKRSNSRTGISDRSYL